SQAPGSAPPRARIRHQAAEIRPPRAAHAPARDQPGTTQRPTRVANPDRLIPEGDSQNGTSVKIKGQKQIQRFALIFPGDARPAYRTGSGKKIPCPPPPPG